MRYLSSSIEDFTSTKFVLIAGPRQVGKTTVAKHWLESKQGLYLNWDVAENKRSILKRDYLNARKFNALVLDEFHKYAKWKNYLKGLYDSEQDSLKVVVTGSANLDLMRKAGDSLLGRYELLHLYPFSIGELIHNSLPPPPKNWRNPDGSTSVKYEIWERLKNFSGFPEPYTSKNKQQYNRWSARRNELIIKEDLREFSQVRETSLVEHLAVLLPDRVGSPLSLNALREDLDVAHDTISSWVTLLDKLYFCFRIPPYTQKIKRALKKEHKLYLWDWATVTDPAARFENMVACHLFKSVQAWKDQGYGNYELNYIRDREKREIDFVISESRKPLVFIECKLSDEAPSANFSGFKGLYPEVPRVQLLDLAGVDVNFGNIRIVSAAKYLGAFV